MERSFLLCATPRTGSTLLCSLLTATGVAGRPESFFRIQDQAYWAGRFGVPIHQDGCVDFPALAAGAVEAGSTSNGVFSARVMWGTMQVVVGGLDPANAASRDIDLLTEFFGPLVFVHHRREDVVGQAVSWSRAQQSGYWQQGDLVAAEPRYDEERIDRLVRTIREHEDAWRAWFTAQGVDPVETTYEQVVADPERTVGRICSAIGVQVPRDWRPVSEVARQADDVNADWVRRYSASADPGM